MSYNVNVDILETVVASAPVNQKHGPLIAAIASRTDMHGIANVTTREHFVPTPHRILDQDGNVVAQDFQEWMTDQIDRRRGDYLAVWEEFKDSGYLMTEREPILLYFAHDRGDDQTNFTQLKIFEEREFIACYLFNRQSWAKPYSMDSLVEGRETGDRVERRQLGDAWYRLSSAVDMAGFMAEATRMQNAQRERQGRLRLEISSSRSTGIIHTTFAERHPEFNKYPWQGRRFFQDWDDSSAGKSRARICRHWVFDTYDYQSDPNSDRSMSFIPQWGLNRALAKIDKAGKSVYELFGRLQKLDQRVGVPFAWYFYMLHGNRVKRWAGDRIIEAAEKGLIVLPESDYQVLKRWQDQPYGF